MSDAASPSTPVRRERRALPTWARRTIMIGLLLFAVWFLWWATQRGESGSAGPADDPAVVSRVPGPGDKVLRQSEVGAELKPGYDGRVLVNGVEIPEDQMIGALDPGSSEAQRFGVRPNNRNEVFFKPEQGKVIDTLRTGVNTVTIRFWPEKEGEQSARTISWQISVM
jgi:hypothetical protein